MVGFDLFSLYFQNALLQKVYLLLWVISTICLIICYNVYIRDLTPIAYFNRIEKVERERRSGRIMKWNHLLKSSTSEYLNFQGILSISI